jgi:hypothetical protein
MTIYTTIAEIHFNIILGLSNGLFPQGLPNIKFCMNFAFVLGLNNSSVAHQGI